MTNHRLVSILSLSIFCAAACGPDPEALPPDAAAMPIPIDPAGRFTVRSEVILGAPPDGAAVVLAELAGATDGPDDPSRYVVDLMVERLPAGSTKTLATALAPFVAAYVDEKIETIAPRFSDGVRAMATGLARVSSRFGTREQLAIGHDGHVRRTIEAWRFATTATSTIEVELVREVAADAKASVIDERLAITQHAMPIRYAELLRLALDRAVIPSVVPGAGDLSRALRSLVDCDHLGALASEWVGVGSPGLYAEACELGLAAAASKLYDRIAAIDEAPPLSLVVTGTARAVDRNGDGPMDAIEEGRWTGTFDGTTISAGFQGGVP